MTFVERIRRWVGPDEDGVSKTPPRSIPETEPPRPSAGERRGPFWEVPPAAVHEPADPTELPIAQGQELLGPCGTCDGYWTRQIVRGQKPLTCPVCKREGAPED